MKNIINQRIKELREENNLSQMALANACDISQGKIARYELDKAEPRASDIVKLAEYFKVSADYLLGL